MSKWITICGVTDIPTLGSRVVERAQGVPVAIFRNGEAKATCCYCGVGCGIIVQSDGAKVTGVRGDPDHPANFGRLCTKGSTLHLSAQPVLQQQARALFPEMRSARNAPRERASWNDT